MKKQKVNILGSDWEVVEGNSTEYPTLMGCDGYTDSSVKRLVINSMDDFEKDAEAKADLKAYKRQVIRHELIHAFLEESGLSTNTTCFTAWAASEEIVDWIAIQTPKIYRACEQLGVLQ